MDIDFKKGDGLVPVIIQDALNMQVLMLGYMNAEAYQKTIAEDRVTFFSRSKNSLWTKGETSGNFLQVQSISMDCDNDTLLIMVKQQGPTCHTGAYACFGAEQNKGFLYKLQATIEQRVNSDDEQSYTRKIYLKGLNKIAQKVGEEAVELVIEAKDNNLDLFKNEAADLLFHFLLLLKAKQVKLEDVEAVLQQRNKS